MPDVFTKKRRSEIMSSIKGKGTGLDKAMRQILTNSRVRFKEYPSLFGKPDFLVGSKVVIFCDSSFWHGRNWKQLKGKLTLGSNPSYWVGHIGKNRRRDRYVTRRLRRMGYTVLRFWDIDIYNRPQWCLSKIKKT